MPPSFISNLLARAGYVPSENSAIPAPVATTTVDSANSAEVKFGFAASSFAPYSPDQTYVDFVAAQAASAGLTLQPSYIARFVVGSQSYVIDPSLTFVELNAKYNTTNEPVSVVIPNPERPVGKNG